jgi:chromosome segregation ATPase
LHNAINSITDERDRWRSCAEAAREEAAERSISVSVLSDTVSAMRRDLASAGLRMGDLERALDDARHAIADRDDAVAALAATLAARQDDLASAGTRLHELSHALDDAQHLIASVTGSRAWKMANWIRGPGRGRS